MKTESSTSPFRNDQPMIQWAQQVLEVAHHKTYDNIETITKTPWSTVLKLGSSSPYVYLKQTPKELFLETEIINLLRKKCNVSNIPEIIAKNEELHCFLLKDCGDSSLREHFNGNLQLEIFEKGLKPYKALQKLTTNHIDEFLALGVPDWRLDKFPELYQKLMDIEWLSTLGLAEAEVKKLGKSCPTVIALCRRLSEYALPDCLSHSDFHDGNMLYLIKTQEVSIIDLGETAINHPFFSLATCFHKVTSHYGLTKESKAYLALKQICFEGLTDKDQDLEAILTIVNTLLPIYLIFAHLRLQRAIYPFELETIPRMKGRLKKAFLWFLGNIER